MEIEIEELIGKEISVTGNGEEFTACITDVNQDALGFDVFYGENEQNSFFLKNKDVDEFSAGNKKVSFDGLSFSVIVEEEEPVVAELVEAEPVVAELIESEILNKPEFKYYIVDNNNKICSGYEYKEDTRPQLKRHAARGENYYVRSFRDLVALSIDANNDASWKSESVNLDLIFDALQQSRNAELSTYKGDYDTKEVLIKAFDDKKYTPLKDMVKKLVREYSDMFSMWADEKEDSNYLKAKKYLLPLIKQSEIIGDLKK